MNVVLVIKQIGKKRDILSGVPIELADGAWTLSHLIDHIVKINVRMYNDKQADANIVQYLTPADIAEQADSGKVSFGRRYSPHDADPQTAVDASILAFMDGLYRVFIDDVEIERLEDVLPLTEGCRITFIRLVFLAGSMY